MNFLKRLFGRDGTSGAGSAGDPTGLYYYVRPHGCDEVIQVRIDRNNDLSLADDNTTYWVRKHVRGVECRQAVEMELFFDANRRLTHSELQGGELVAEADFVAWQQTRAS